MIRENKYATKIQEFQQYCLDFYNNETGFYPIAKPEFIIQSVNEYLESKLLGQIHFDSFDRYEVRAILELGI